MFYSDFLFGELSLESEKAELVVIQLEITLTEVPARRSNVRRRFYCPMQLAATVVTQRGERDSSCSSVFLVTTATPSFPWSTVWWTVGG